jgi:hypothetical protein
LVVPFSTPPHESGQAPVIHVGQPHRRSEDRHPGGQPFRSCPDVIEDVEDSIARHSVRCQLEHQLPLQVGPGSSPNTNGWIQRARSEGLQRNRRHRTSLPSLPRPPGATQGLRRDSHLDHPASATKASSATVTISPKVRSLASAVVTPPVRIWSDTVRMARALAPRSAATP